jgi:hypothetical protein
VRGDADHRGQGDAEILKLAGPATRRVRPQEAGGGDALNDRPSHPTSLRRRGTLHGRLNVGYDAAKSVADVVRLVGERARGTKANWLDHRNRMGRGKARRGSAASPRPISTPVSRPSGVTRAYHRPLPRGKQRALRMSGYPAALVIPRREFIDRHRRRASGVLQNRPMDLVRAHWHAGRGL